MLDTDPNDEANEEVIKGADVGKLHADRLTTMDNYLRAIASYTDGKGKDTSMATTAGRGGR